MRPNLTNGIQHLALLVCHSFSCTKYGLCSENRKLRWILKKKIPNCSSSIQRQNIFAHSKTESDFCLVHVIVTA
jgi:hypothetical protein